MRESNSLLLSRPLSCHPPGNGVSEILRITPFVWLNLVCLDAPIVALTWQWLFSRNFHISLTPWSRAALFLTGWLIYLTDRLADTWTLGENSSRSLRQEFCQRHQRAWIAAIAGIGVVDLFIIIHQLDRKTIHFGIVVGAISLVYLTVNYWLGKVWRFLPLKEICVGSLFAFGTVTALFPQIDFSTAFIAAFLLFASLCSFNCISIAAWERKLDRAQRKDSIATRWNGIGFCLRPGAFALVVLAISMAIRTKSSAPVYVCIATSAVLLGTLDGLGERIPRDGRTALADLVLLTPLFFWGLGIA
jgi:hypothetical protein